MGVPEATVHEWLRRYGVLLRGAVPQAAAKSSLAVEIDQVIVGGIASRVASEVLRGRGARLRELGDPFLEYVLTFYRLGESGPKEGRVLPFESEDRSADPSAAPRKQASA